MHSVKKLQVNSEEPVFLSQRFKRNFNRATSGKLKPLRKNKSRVDITNTSSSSNLHAGGGAGEETSARHSITVKDIPTNETPEKKRVNDDNDDNEAAYTPHLYSPFPLGAKSSFSPTSIQKSKLSSLPLYLRAKYSAYEAPPPVYPPS
jgi:hypothetical protein